MDDEKHFGLQAREEPRVATEGTQRITGDSVETLGIERAAADDFRPARASILSTARNNAGSPTGTLTPETSIELPGGLRTSLAVAELQGYVRRDASGLYTEVASAEQPNTSTEQDQQQQQQDNPDAPVPFSDVDEAMATQFTSQIPGQMQDAIVSQVLTGGLEGVDLKNAPIVGMTPDQLRGGVSAFINLFQQQADALVTKSGADPQEFYQWARANADAELKDCMRRHVYERNPRAYGALLDRFLRSTSPTTAALQQGGYKPITRGGEEFIVVNGIEVSVAVASRLGLI